MTEAIQTLILLTLIVSMFMFGAAGIGQPDADWPIVGMYVCLTLLCGIMLNMGRIEHKERGIKYGESLSWTGGIFGIIVIIIVGILSLIGVF